MLLNFALIMISKEIYIRRWLYSGLIMVLLMMIIGGVTRITGSGLSITTWSISGEIPNINNIKSSYNLWKKSPQGQTTPMTLNKYKFIYFWEYIHRMLGRIIGIIFIIPFIFFIIKKWITYKNIMRYIFLFILGGIQALIGWWMVKSGLIEKPEVSHFRLAIHFISALFLLSYIWWMILSINNNIKPNEKIYNLAKWFLVLLVVQLIFGAFTAGLKAGYLIDPQSKINTIFGYFNTSNHQNLDFLNNPYNIQLIHRSLAWIIVCFSFYILQISKETHFYNITRLLIVIVLIQISLGIITITLNVHKHLAVTHQFFAIILTLITVYLIHQSQPKQKMKISDISHPS